jgi:hypothetical protein
MITTFDMEKIEEAERWLTPDVRQIPRPVRLALERILAWATAGEDTDYLENCSEEKGGNQRRGHHYEDLLRVTRWLKGHVSGGRVETRVWVPARHPDYPAEEYVRPARRKSVGEVRDELTLLLGSYPDGAEEGGLGVYPGTDPDQPWPAGQVIAYARPGGCEGWNVYVEVADLDVDVPASDAGTPMIAHRILLCGKTLSNEDGAYALARHLTWMFGGE